jgi:hypothetical protein
MEEAHPVSQTHWDLNLQSTNFCFPLLLSFQQWNKCDAIIFYDKYISYGSSVLESK